MGLLGLAVRLLVGMVLLLDAIAGLAYAMDAPIEATVTSTKCAGGSSNPFFPPLLAGQEFSAGQYELVFAAGDYLRRQGIELPSPAFLDEIPIRFGMADAKHYHVPLLISPYGYSTYRGS